MLLYLTSESIEVARPRVRRERVPRRESCTRRFNPSIYILRAPLSDGRKLVTCRWISGIEVLAFDRRLPASIDELPKLPFVAIEPAQRLFRILQCRAVLHRCEFFRDFRHES